MAKVHVPKLDPQVETALNDWLRRRVKLWLVWFGFMNLVAILGAFVYVVDFAARRAGEQAQQRVKETTEQWEALQSSLMNQISRNLIQSGQLTEELEVADRQLASLQKSLTTLEATPEGTFKELGNLLEKHPDDFGQMLDFEARLTNLLQDSLQVEPLKHAACADRNGCKIEEDLGAVDRRLCFLQGSRFEDLDSGGEWGSCLVTQEEGEWVLVAALGPRGDDHKAACSAQCLTW